MTLIERAVAQIQKDVASGDVTAIEELLAYVPEQFLVGFLSEYLVDEDPPAEILLTSR